MCSRNRQRELHRVEAGDSTPKDDAPSVNGYPDIAQCTVAGCAQGAFDSFGQAVVFQAQQEGAVARRARFLSVRCGRVGSVVDWPIDNTPCQTHGETWSLQFGRLAGLWLATAAGRRGQRPFRDDCFGRGVRATCFDGNLYSIFHRIFEGHLDAE